MRVLGREVVERQQCFFILGQTGDGRRVFDPIFFIEDVYGDARRGLGFSVMDLLQVGFDRRRHGLRELAKNVRDLVKPADPMGRWIAAYTLAE